jgi:hypothetical protein
VVALGGGDLDEHGASVARGAGNRNYIKRKGLDYTKIPRAASKTLI